MSETIDEVLEGLVATRQSMQNQVDKIGEIIEKSNSTLLHIESQYSMLPPPTTTAIAENIYNVSAECEQSVVKILVQFQQLMQHITDCNSNAEPGGQSALNNCMTSRQCVEYLGSSVRKLVGLCDIIAHLKQSVEELQIIEDDEDL